MAFATGAMFKNRLGSSLHVQGSHIVSGALSSDAAKHHEVSNSVAAQAVGTMHATGDLTGCEQTGDGRTVLGAFCVPRCETVG